jgi:hypothetical protein
MPHSFQLLVPGGHSVEEEKVSGTNGTVEDYQHSAERAEVLLTRDQFFGILVVVW